MRQIGLAVIVLALTAMVPARAYFGSAVSLTKAFSPASFTSGGFTVLTFTVSNSVGAGAVSNVGFVDTLPANLVVASAPNVGGTCANAAAATVATAGSNTITTSALQVPAGGGSGSTCTVTVNVTNKAGATGTCPDATFTNGSSNVVPTNVGNSVTPSCVTVLAAVPTTTRWVWIVMAAIIGLAGSVALRRRARPAPAR